jgi:hypothetical protein
MELSLVNFHALSIDKGAEDGGSQFGFVLATPASNNFVHFFFSDVDDLKINLLTLSFLNFVALSFLHIKSKGGRDVTA